MICRCREGEREKRGGRGGEREREVSAGNNVITCQKDCDDILFVCWS